MYDRYGIKKYVCAFLLFVLLFFVATLAAQANTSVYKITYQGQVLYLGGTIHLLKETDYPLPDAYDKAYAAASVLVFETDMQAMQQPNLMLALLESMKYQGGRTIQAVLAKETYQLLQKEAALLGIPFKQVAVFKPLPLIAMLLSVKLHRLGVNAVGVDMFFSEKAQQDAKSQQYLESLETQMAMAAKVGEGEEDRFIRYALNDFNTMDAQWHHMVQAWRNGDHAQLEKDFLQPMQTLPQVYQQLLVQRNQAWLIKMMQMLGDEPVELVLVGAAHLLGKDGLLHLLAEKGCVIEQMS